MDVFRGYTATTREWSTTNPVLPDGQMGRDSLTKRFKIGDGVTRWNDLPSYGPGEGAVFEPPTVILGGTP